MNVTFCAYDRPGSIGGPNAWLERLLPALRARGLDPDVLVVKKTPDDTPMVQALRAQGIPCRELVLPADAGLGRQRGRIVRWLVDQVAREPPAVFVPNVVDSAYHAAARLRATGMPTVGVLHSDDAFHRDLQRAFVVGPARDRVSAVACVSRWLEEDVRARAPKGLKVARMPYGVELPSRVAQPPGATLRLVYVGRLVEPQKRIAETARALCRATREVPGTEAVLVGDGPARNDVERILAEEGGGRVRLTGRLPLAEVPRALAASHAIVLLSDYEGLPIAVLEGMACGLVPLCSPVRSGIPELVEDRQTGLLVPDRGDAFVAAVRCLREEPGLWDSLSRASRARVASGYTHDASADRWAAWLRSLAGEAPAATRKPPSSRASRWSRFLPSLGPRSP